jgi:hypothetical protein
VFYVNLTILGEPILALVIMYLLRAEFEVFRESRMDLLQLVGGVLLMTGVVIGLWKRRRRVPVEVAA